LRKMRERRSFLERTGIRQVLKSRKLRMTVPAMMLTMLLTLNIVLSVAGMPVFASESELVCTQTAHTHGESCYETVDCTDAERIGCAVSIHSHDANCTNADGELVCGKADYVIHKHNEYCFDADGGLVCWLSGRCVEAHTHSADCYDGESGELTCALPEVKAHTHSSSCYKVTEGEAKSVLTCTLPVAELHTHTNSCYALSENVSSSDAELVCTLPEGHAHTDACYTLVADPETTVTELVCTQLEVKVHNHSASCISESMPEQKSVLSCTVAEHTHDDTCYGEPADSDDESDSAAASSSDIVYPSDVLSGSDAFAESEMSILFNSLLIEESAEVLAVADAEIVTGTKMVYEIPAQTEATFTYTPGVTHSYSYAYTYNSGWDYVYIYDQNGETINQNQSTRSGAVMLEGGQTYTLKIKNTYSSAKTFSATFTIDSNNHAMVNGECACGLRESDFGGSCGENATWSIKDGVLTITGTGPMANYTYNSIPWKEITSLITKVVVDDGITTIGNYAFYDCDRLKEADIPDSVVSIGNAAFYNCDSLAEFDFPDNLTSISSNAFSGCAKLESVDIPDSVATIGSYAFGNCASLKSAVLPEGLTSIDSFFNGCEALESVNIPDSVTRIGDSSFSGCKSLKSIDVPDNVTSIGNYAFNNCAALEAINIPEGVTSIGNYAFNNCAALEAINIPEGVTSIGNYAFYNCAALEAINIPEGVTSIGNYLFYGCSSLESVVIPEGVTRIGSYAFANCTALKSADIPGTVTNISEYAFDSCQSLESIVIPEGVKSILNYTFYRCTSLRSVELPDSLSNIYSSAFRGCSVLDGIVIPENVDYIGSYAFTDCAALKSIVIPEGVTSISYNTFLNCSSLESVVLPEGLTSIGDYAFQNCGRLEDVELPDSLKSLGKQAFSGDYKINTLYLPESLTSANEGVISGGIDAEVYVDSANLTSISKSAVSDYKYVNKLTIGSKVDHITSSLADFIAYLPNISTVDFVGENFLTVDKQLNVTGVGITFEAGEYYVDADGAVYRLDKDNGTAELCFVPSNLTEYTVISKTSADESGTEYTVTGVRPNALKNAGSLASLDFADPDAIISLPSGALANCPTLESVNGESTVKGAYDTFKNADAIKADQVFYNTGLEDEVTIADGGVSIFGNDEDLMPLIKVIPQKNSGANNAEFKDTYTYYTGEYEKITIGISNANAGDYEAVRVYFAFDGDGGQLSWPFGTQSFESDQGTEYDIKTVRSDIANVYYVECPRLNEGDTISAYINTFYPSPTTDGGKLRVWPVVLTESDLEKVGNGVTSPKEVCEIEWVTKADDFAITKTVNQDHGSEAARLASKDGEHFIANLAYTIKFNRTGDTLQGMGKDHVAYVEYTDTVTLSEGLAWDDEVINAIKNGDVSCTVRYSTNYVYLVVNGVKKVFCSIYNNQWNSPVTDISLGLTDDNNLQIKWTVRNNSADTAELNTANYEISFYRGDTTGYTVGNKTFYPSYINCVDLKPEHTYTIENDVEALQHFSFSEDQRDTAEADKDFVTEKPDFDIRKSWASDDYDRWGASLPYRINVSNTSSFEFTGLSHVNDALDKVFYMSPENVQKTFDELLENTDVFKEVSVKITNATLCSDTADPYTPGAEITATDGTKRTLAQANSGVGTLYNGCESSDPAVYDTSATLTITCKADGTQTLTYGSKSVDASDVHSAFEAVGYIVTDSACYELTWVFADGYALQPGEEVVFDIHAAIKDSFMQANADAFKTLSHNYLFVPDNTVYAWYNESGESEAVNKSFTYKEHRYIYSDFNIAKTHNINGDADVETVIAGDIVNYTVSIQHYGGAAYEILPLTDRMHGAQVLLVPAEVNSHLSECGLTVQTIDGGAVYAINKEGVYRNVTVGGMLADSVTVTADAAGFDTFIRWYMADVPGDLSKNISYKALVDTESTGVSALIYSLTNETWLNDHQTHRLWATLTGEGIGGTGVDFNKYIVTQKGDDHDEDILSTLEPVNEGESILYRLSISSIGSSVTITGDDIYDSLPKVLDDVYVWSKDNVTLSYEPAENSSYSISGVDSEDASWDIASVPSAWTGISAAEDQQYICWSEDMELTVSGTLYIYVTLQMPDGDAWAANASKYSQTRLENSFYVLTLKKSVYHDLAITAEAYLMKGVWDTGVNTWNGSSQYCEPRRTTPDSRIYFHNSIAVNTELVSYYIALYNGGNTRIYLDTIYEVLPDGVKPWQNYKSTSVSSFYFGEFSNGYLKVTDKDGNTQNPSWRSFDTSVSYDVANNILGINLKGGSLRYDSQYSRYYLAPGEAVKLIIPCYIEAREYTGDYITNTVAMKYFDYLTAGVAVSENTASLNPTAYNALKGVEPNDGVCRIIDTAQANQLGIKTGRSNDQWLASDVTMQRGTMTPGITKSVESFTTPAGYTVAAGDTAGTDDTINWKIQLTSGNDDISVWKFTDVMNPDYGFTGPVSLQIRDLYVTREFSLFTIERDTDNLDNITVKYRASTSSTQTSAAVVRGGDAITFNAYVGQTSIYNSYTRQYEYRNIFSDITLRMYVDEKGNEVLSFEILNPELTISSDGYANVRLSTKIFGTWANKVYYNNAYLTPLTQTYDETRVSQGNHVLFGEQQEPSVRNSAQITAAYGYVTSSEKRVSEIGNEENSASSKDVQNWIFLDDHTDTVRYTNIVNNITGRSLSRFIMIDNLPEVGDHATFAETEDRYSDFNVELLEDPDFEVSMNISGSKTVLTEDQYIIMFSDRTEFSGSDWSGDNDAGWYSEPRSTTRSFRVEIYDDTGLVIPDKASIHVAYSGRIIAADDYKNDSVTTNPAEGDTAWNSFGYRYSVLGENISLEAAPLKVGINIQHTPNIKKTLVYPNGAPFTAERDESFRFIIYTGSQITSLAGKTEQEIANLLKSNNRSVTVVDLSVKSGESESESYRIDSSKAMTYDSASGLWVESDTEWKFENGNSYTVFELDDKTDIYDIRTVGTSNVGNYTFTYSGQTPIEIVAVNERMSWTARVNKVDAAEGKPLADAVFGVYSTVEREMISDEDYANLSLEESPERTVTYNGKTWYLYQVATTGTGGAAIFNGLVEETYIVRELQAPGGYRVSNETYEFAGADADSSFVNAREVVNYSDYELPETGDSGAGTAILIGGIMMLAAAALFVFRKRLA